MAVYFFDIPLIWSVINACLYIIFDWVQIELVVQFATQDLSAGWIVNNWIRNISICGWGVFWDVYASSGATLFEASIWDLMTGRALLFYNFGQDYGQEANSSPLSYLTSLYKWFTSDADSNKLPLVLNTTHIRVGEEPATVGFVHFWGYIFFLFVGCFGFLFLFLSYMCSQTYMIFTLTMLQVFFFDLYFEELNS